MDKIRTGKYMTLRRRLHDAWAIFLYLGLLFTIALATSLSIPAEYWIISKLKHIFWPAKSIITAEVATGVAIGGTIALILAALTIFFCIYCPRVLVVASIIVSLLILAATFARLLILALSIKYFSTLVVQAVGGCAALISILAFLYLAYSVLRRLSLIGILLSVSARIFLSNILAILLVLACAMAISLLNIISYHIVEGRYRIAILSLCALNTAWLFVICVYFYRVMTASIAFSEVTLCLCTFSTPINNSVFATGSIALGALILSISLLPIRRPSAETEQQSTSLDILRVSNRLEFPYLAVHGSSYSESVINSFDMAKKYPSTLSFYAVDAALLLFAMVCATLIGVPSSHDDSWIKELSSRTGWKKTLFGGINYFCFPFQQLLSTEMILPLVLYMTVLACLSGAALGLLFTFVSNPTEMEAFNPRLQKAFSDYFE